MNILLSLPDELTAQIDEIVQQRKLVKKTFLPLNDVQRLQAKEIAAKDGVASANAFILSIQQPTSKGSSSRVGVICELLSLALCIKPEEVPLPAPAPTPPTRTRTHRIAR